MFHLTTCSGRAPPAANAAWIFFRICSVCALRSPLPIIFPDASTASCPPIYIVFAGPLTTTTFVNAGFLERVSGFRYCTWPFPEADLRGLVIFQLLSRGYAVLAYHNHSDPFAHTVNGRSP